jgi:eukaryotic-like serine/threonine-protein kinase
MHAQQMRSGETGSAGRYRIVGLLGAGGMGTVVEAIDTSRGRSVALKFARRRTGDTTSAVKQLSYEAAAMTRARSPHVCEVIGVTTCEGQPCLAMESLSGRVLQCRLARGQVAIGAVVDLGLQLAFALERVHGAGLVHQDIKPANIFITSSGLIKLLDFGAAARFDALPDARVKRPSGSEVLGTTNYIAPERILRQPPDPRSDLFSLGAVLYEMVTGRQPFAGISPAEVLFNVLDLDPPSLRAFAPDCPAALDRIVRRLLAKRPERRFQSATHLRGALLRLRERMRPDGTSVTRVLNRRALRGQERRPVPAGTRLDHDAALGFRHVASLV